MAWTLRAWSEDRFPAISTAFATYLKKEKDVSVRPFVQLGAFGDSW